MLAKQEVYRDPMRRFDSSGFSSFLLSTRLGGGSDFGGSEGDVSTVVSVRPSGAEIGAFVTCAFFVLPILVDLCRPVMYHGRELPRRAKYPAAPPKTISSATTANACFRTQR
jgi:hypothetical protein